MKSISLVAVVPLCFLAIFMSSKPDQRSDQKTTSPQIEPKTITALAHDQNANTHSQESSNDPPHWYTPIKRPEWWLVIAAYLTLAVLIFQANEMKKATETMRDNTKAFMETQRPKITAKAHGNPTSMLAVPGEPRIELELNNAGLTSASGFLYESWIELLPFPFKDFTDAADHFRSEEPCVLYPQNQPFIINIPLRAGITPRQLSDLRQLRIFACVRIRVEYKDFFISNPVTHNFGFWVQHDGLGFLPKYND